MKHFFVILFRLSYIRSSQCILTQIKYGILTNMMFIPIKLIHSSLIVKANYPIEACKLYIIDISGDNLEYEY